jgi:energy-converting hydrogenase Eha subunit G
MSGITTFQQSLEIASGALFSMQIQLDMSVDTHERYVYTFANVMSELGGFKTALFFIGFIIYFYFQQSQFYLAMARKLFLVEELDDLDHPNNQ